jgi:hypothetical protein
MVLVLQDKKSDPIDLYVSNGKLSIFGDFKTADNGSAASGVSYTADSSKFNNLYLEGSHDNSAFFRMGTNFQMVVDDDGRFGSSFDIAVRYIKICTTNEINNGSNNSLNVQYAFKS